jgi:hypothetical protein
MVPSLTEYETKSTCIALGRMYLAKQEQCTQFQPTHLSEALLPQLWSVRAYGITISRKPRSLPESHPST